MEMEKVGLDGCVQGQVGGRKLGVKGVDFKEFFSFYELSECF